MFNSLTAEAEMKVFLQIASDILRAKGIEPESFMTDLSKTLRTVAESKVQFAEAYDKHDDLQEQLHQAQQEMEEAKELMDASLKNAERMLHDIFGDQ